MKKTQQLNFIDIFSGAGGLSCGMELAGHKCLLGVDMDKHAMKTFAHNHKHANIYCGDIKKLSPKLLSELTGNQKINIVVGGPPCQGFSTVGTGDPKDERNSLFRQFVRIVKLTAPEFIIVENVTGLLAKKNEKTLRAILQQFAQLGYKLDVQVMSAQQYGVPEKRRRTIILGTKVNDLPTFPLPTHDIEIRGRHKKPVSVGEALKKLTARGGKLLNHDLDAALVKNKMDLRRLKRIPEGKGIRYKHDEDAYLTKSLKLGVDWEKLPERRFRQTKFQRLDSSLPSPTIMTHRHSYYHPHEDRFLTQREAAKLQSFPNDFEFFGPVSAQWRQIGNAVPPLLGKALGQACSEMFSNQSSKKRATKSQRILNETILDQRSGAFAYKS